MSGYKGDIRAFVDALGVPLQIEVKARATADGWGVTKKWLGENDMLFLIEDRQEPLVMLSWRTFSQLLVGLQHYYQRGESHSYE